MYNWNRKIIRICGVFEIVGFLWQAAIACAYTCQQFLLQVSVNSVNTGTFSYRVVFRRHTPSIILLVSNCLNNTVNLFC